MQKLKATGKRSWPKDDAIPHANAAGFTIKGVGLKIEHNTISIEGTRESYYEAAVILNV